MRVTESALEQLIDDIVDAENTEAREEAIAAFVASLTPNGPAPAFLDPLIDAAEADVYTRIYRAAKKWVRKAFKSDPKKRAARRKKRKARRASR